MKTCDILTILGPTASGKTNLACQLAYQMDTEIISADSRQVYRGMDIGTGKDLSDYEINGKKIPYHIIDILPAGDKYNLFEYQKDFHEAYNKIKAKNKLPILCGGTGLYIESVLKGYSLVDVPENKALRNHLEQFDLNELKNILKGYYPERDIDEISERRRTIRAIEIEEYRLKHNIKAYDFPPLNSLIIGIDVDRNVRRARISKRLRERLKEGMIEEVENLLNSGISHDDLIYYGLEYKFVTKYILGEYSLDEMTTLLETAIHQFAKRQMTWFRGMEKRGLKIHWIKENLTLEKKLEQIKLILNKQLL